VGFKGCMVPYTRVLKPTSQQGYLACVTCRGDNSYGQTSPPPQLASGTLPVLALAAGADHSLALLSDGSVRAWGGNLFGQTVVPWAALSDVVALSTEYNTNLALRKDGTVVGWGDDVFGQASPPAFLQPGGVGGARAIAAAVSMSFALLGNGSVAAWGMPSPMEADMHPVTELQGGTQTDASDTMLWLWPSLCPGSRDPVLMCNKRTGIRPVQVKWHWSCLAPDAAFEAAVPRRCHRHRCWRPPCAGGCEWRCKGRGQQRLWSGKAAAATCKLASA
jgi:hypothetical protein